MSTQPPPPDPRVARTRALLAGALTDLLDERPFARITVTDIAARAGVHRATFYDHFTDKHAMVLDLFAERFAQLLRRHVPDVPDVPDGDAGGDAVLRGLLLAVAEHRAAAQGPCSRTHRLFAAPVEQEARAQLRAAVRTWLAERAASSRARAQLDLVASLTSWSLYGAAVDWDAGGGRAAHRQTPEVLAARTVPAIAASVRALLRS